MAYENRRDYLEAVKADVLEYINSEINFKDYETLEDLKEALHDECFNADSVTGNASGSYYCNAWRAEEAISHNWDLIEEAAEAFGIEPTISSGCEHGAEWWDVTIRCYLLGEAIEEAAEEIEDDFNEAHEEDEEEA